MSGSTPPRSRRSLSGARIAGLVAGDARAALTRGAMRPGARASLLLALAMLAAGCAASTRNGDAPNAAHPPRTTFVLVHGAWGGGWDWWTVDSLLTRRGHRVERVTLTGLGERVHLASAEIGLDTHVTDVVNRIVWERLEDVVLVGHSYGGVVVTGAADRVPERIRSLVYVDAILPESGRSVADVMGGELGDAMRAAEDGFLAATWEPADRPVPKDVPHPVRTLTDTLVLRHATPPVPATYILTEQPSRLPDAFEPFAERAAALGWTVRVMQADHVPERSAPAELVALLLEAAAAR